MRSLLPLFALLACTPEPSESPLEGPGFDEATGELLRGQDEYMVALTYLEVRNLPGPGSRFGSHANAIGTHLFETEPAGWMGAGFRNVGRLRWWTMTVWESEEEMMDFVVAEPHVSAMLDINEVSRGAVNRSLWMAADELPLSWSDAMTLLIEAQDTRHGEPSWP